MQQLITSVDKIKIDRVIADEKQAVEDRKRVEQVNADLQLNDEWKKMKPILRNSKLGNLKDEHIRLFLNKLNDENQLFVVDYYSQLKYMVLYTKWNLLPLKYQNAIEALWNKSDKDKTHYFKISMANYEKEKADCAKNDGFSKHNVVVVHEKRPKRKQARNAKRIIHDANSFNDDPRGGIQNNIRANN